MGLVLYDAPECKKAANAARFPLRHASRGVGAAMGEAYSRTGGKYNPRAVGRLQTLLL
jgi:hypothetical protein